MRRMAPRSVASGTISFGLVSIPVKLFPATQAASAVSFNMLHGKDGARLKQQYVCSKDGQVVSREETVKGYEFAKDQYVTFTAEELKALDEIASQAIDISEFVPAAEVDPVYFDKTYYLGPDKGGARAYRLLAEALKRSGKAALGRYSARGKQYLVLIRPKGPRLVMQQLFYADEVRAAEEVELDQVEVKETEIELALQLIEQTARRRLPPGALQGRREAAHRGGHRAEGGRPGDPRRLGRAAGPGDRPHGGAQGEHRRRARRSVQPGHRDAGRGARARRAPGHRARGRPPPGAPGAARAAAGQGEHARVTGAEGVCGGTGPAT